MNTRKKAISGIKWSGSSGIIIAAIQFVSTILLARFLTKSEMGEIAVIQTLVGITVIFLDMGVSNAIVYQKDITQEQLSGVFWMNIFSGVLFSIISFALAVPIGIYFNSADLPGYIRWVSLSFFILSASRIFKFLFIKYLHLKDVSLSEIISYSLSFVFMLVLLYKGYRAYAFVFSIILRSLLQSIYLVFKGLKIFIPKLIFRRKSLKSLYRYGMFNLAEMLTDYINSQWDTILIGRLLGLETLGVYNIAKTLAYKPMQLLSPVVSKVNFPLMSQVQDQPRELKKYYLLSVKYLFATLVVVYLSLIVESDDLIRILYSNKWDDAVPYLQLLSIYFLVRTVRNPLGSLVLASGKVHWRFYWNLVLLVVLPVLIYFTSRVGLFAVITGLILWYATALYISYRLITRHIIPLRFVELLKPVIRLLLMMIPSLAIAFVLKQVLSPAWLRLVLISGISLLIYILILRKAEPGVYAELLHFIGKQKVENSENQS